MKKIFFIAISILFFNGAIAQELPTPDYNELDKQFVDIDTTKITSGILYERTAQLANLYNFNLSDSLNTANYDYFKQSILELYNASKARKFMHSNSLENTIEENVAYRQKNVVPIGIINTDFQILSYWENSRYQGVRFDSIQQKYYKILGKEPFYTLHTTIISPLKSAVEGDEIEFLFNSDYLFTFEKPIKSLIATFDNGVTFEVLRNGVFILNSVKIRYEISGLKRINYQIVYNDNTTVSTNSTLYVLNKNQASNLFTSCSTNDVLRQDFALTAVDEFTGYKSTDPKIKAKFDYRVYYSNGNSAKKILKPIIIVDGFDPGDKRKIEDCDCQQDADCAARNLTNGVFDPEKHKSIIDMIMYVDNGQIKKLLNELRSKGFDVIIVNFPKYTTTNLLNGQTVSIDGGAYYIESNGLAFVKLLKDVRNQVAANGSINKTTVIAPSMAGQISRYALSYMEKKFQETTNNDWLHNVSLWVSVDSPHLGANIPLGIQGLLYRLQSQSAQASDFYQKELGSPASQQQLIEFHQQQGNNANPAFQNGKTISQGLPSNSGNSFFQQHYNKQNSNGTLGSNGFPQNLRKIAVINGSLTGSKETQTLTGQNFTKFEDDGKLVLSIRGFQTIKIFGVKVGTVHVASLESRFLPTTNSSIKISRFHKTSTDRPVYAGNVNSRGVMDNVPGGFFDSQEQIKKSILSNTGDFVNFNIILGTNGYWSLREFNPIHSFIPTFSALAHLQPNQSWANPVNTNLTCPTNKKTPFDSYFGIAKNTPHTSFTKECVDWLLKELDGLPQPPNFPIQESALSGSNLVCYNANNTYTINDICKVPGIPVWSVEGNIAIVSFTDYSVTVTGSGSSSNSSGNIIATFGGQVFKKLVHVGVPSYVSQQIQNGFDNVPINSSSNLKVNAVPFAQEYYWTIFENGTNCGCVTNSDGLTYCPQGIVKPKFPNNSVSSYTTTSLNANINWGNCAGTYTINCFAKNECGLSPINHKIVTVYKTTSGNDPCTGTLSILPNPINRNTNLGGFTADISYPGGGCNDPTNYGSNKNEVKIYDLNGTLFYSQDFYTDSMRIDNLSFPKGNYVLNVFTYKGYSKREIIIME